MDPRAEKAYRLLRRVGWCASVYFKQQKRLLKQNFEAEAHGGYGIRVPSSLEGGREGGRVLQPQPHPGPPGSGLLCVLDPGQGPGPQSAPVLAPGLAVHGSGGCSLRRCRERQCPSRPAVSTPGGFWAEERAGGCGSGQRRGLGAFSRTQTLGSQLCVIWNPRAAALVWKEPGLGPGPWV